jgi:hypothetical protein
MTLAIDHLVYAAPDPTVAADDLARRLGVAAVLGGRHQGMGTYNMLAGLGGDTYLEIIGPDPDQQPPDQPRPFGVDSLTQAALVGWALRCDAIDHAVAAARAGGYDTGPALTMERVRPDGATIAWRLTTNAVGGGAVPFLIDWGSTEHPSHTAPAGLELVSFVIEHPSPPAIRAALDALGSDVEVRAAPVAALVATIRGPLGELELR